MCLLFISKPYICNVSIYFHHIQVFTAPMVTKLIEMYKNAAESSKPLILFILKSTAEKNPKLLVEFFPQMCDDTIFKPATMNQRSGIIACIGGINAVRI